MKPAPTANPSFEWLIVSFANAIVKLRRPSYSRHACAGLRAAVAHVRTVQELGIAIREIVAVFRTTFTHIGTCATHIPVTRRLDEHQARAGLAQLGTSQEQRCHMRLGGVFATTKVRNGCQTSTVTIQTILDALVSVRGVTHGNSPLPATHN